MPNRIIIFDDNRDRLDSVSMLLNVAEDLECVGTYLNTAKALDIVEQTRPDLVLMDIDMPGDQSILTFPSSSKLSSMIIPEFLTVFELELLVIYSKRRPLKNFSKAFERLLKGAHP